MKKLVLIVAVMAMSAALATIEPLQKEPDGRYVFPYLCGSPAEARRNSFYCTACTGSLDACLACCDRVERMFGQQAGDWNRNDCTLWYLYGSPPPLQR